MFRMPLQHRHWDNLWSAIRRNVAPANPLTGKTTMNPLSRTAFVLTIAIFAPTFALTAQVANGQQAADSVLPPAPPAGAKLLFEDDFERSESQETSDEPGNGWTTNSKKRAAGNKQVDLKDGALNIYIHPAADHGVSVVHDAAFENGLIQLRFLLPEKSSSLTLDFADQKYKKVHAGHLAKVAFKTSRVEIADLKTGIFDKEIRDARLKKTLTDQQQAMLKTKTMKFKHNIAPGVWHSATIKIQGDTIAVSVNQKSIGEFSSPGIAHPTKRVLRLAVPKQAWVDDLKVYALPTAPLSPSPQATGQ